MIQRLDKFLSDAQIGTRKEIKHFISKGLVTVDSVTVKDPSQKRDYSLCKVCFDGQEVLAKRNVVLVMNKPAGFVTSTDDPLSRTVYELLPEKYKREGLVPVGRLDKDTEGVLLFTNDGDLLHKLISPKSNVEKTYYAEFEGLCPEDASSIYNNGIELKDGSICKSAKFEKLSESSFRITITQGMYHQVKRMAAALGMHVTYLKRESFNSIRCDNLEKGQVAEVLCSLGVSNLS